MPSTIDRVTEYLGTATAALSDVSGSAKSAAQVLSLLGWAPPPGVDDIGLALLDVSTLEARLDELIELRSHDETSDADLALGIVGVVGAVADAYDGINILAPFRKIEVVGDGSGESAEFGRILGNKLLVRGFAYQTDVPATICP